jgi:HAD superfamily hydrolase (TIGR01490 family)
MGSRAAAFFDLDKTIIATSASTAFSRPFYDGGLLSRRAAVRTAYAHLMFMVGRADEDQTERLRRQLSAMVAGWEVSQVSAIVAETVRTSIEPTVYAEAIALITDHQAHGRDVVVVSASGAEVVEPIAALLGADDAIATRLEVEEGRYTGRIAFYAYGENKAAAVREMADRRGYDLAECYAYSDSITDLPLLQAVGHAAVVNPDRTLRRIADERGWDALTFRRPVALRPHLPPPRRTVPALTVLVLGVVLGVLLSRRRRTRPSS